MAGPRDAARKVRGERMGLSVAEAVRDLWEPGRAPTDPLGLLVYRSNLLGADRSVANYGGGNTSAKLLWLDHTGRERDVLWVKASGSDLATISEGGFVGLKLDEVLPLLRRGEMTDEEMVAYLAACQLRPSMPRASIETLLHAFLPYAHVDHTHPDATNMICCSEDGEHLARECYGDDMVWIPYIRPGFALSKLVAEAVSANPSAKLALLAKHGLVTWGDTAEECYRNTLDAIRRAARFVSERSVGLAPFGGPAVACLGAREREDILASVLPALRGSVAGETPKILRVDGSERVMEFVCGRHSGELSRVGAACPDHLVHTKARPLWVPFDPDREAAADLEARLLRGVEDYRNEYEAYFQAHRSGAESMSDPYPRVVLIPGVGMVTIGKDAKAAGLSADLFHRAIEVMRGASDLGGFVSLSDAESYAVEYWPLELYKLTLAPPPKELAGMVAVVTGGAGGIGSAVARSLARHGANIVVADMDGEGAGQVASDLPISGRAAAVDVTDEAQIARLYRCAVLEYGGVDVVVSNAGLASSAPLEETSVESWDKNHAVLARGYFLVSREAFRVLKRQGTGGAIVFVASKNSLVAGKNAAAYSSAKAAELHLARCLAEEGGAYGIRVNTVNPDAVLQGSKIWGTSWREERARAYGIPPEELEEYYRKRTTLGVNVLPEDVAEAVLYFASPDRSGKSTGNILNVDGGVPAAYPR
jgi:rhamnulose-1-phosphate aldolase/alcohol dehydrogenase